MRAGAGVGDDDHGALVRPTFFPGQLLTADDFAAAQDDARERLDRRNRMLCGAGIVDGLGVTVEGDSEATAHVVVAPGRALPVATTGPTEDAHGDPTHPQQPSRIVETFELALAATPPGDDALAIARVRRLRDGWRVDPRFRAARFRR